MMTKNLTYLQQQRLLHNFFSVIEPLEPYSEMLSDAGFKSFQAGAEFERECCDTDLELAALPRYVLERARAQFSSPDGLSGQWNTFCPWGNRYDWRNKLEYGRLLKMQEDSREKLVKYRQHEYTTWRKASVFDPYTYEDYVDYFSESMLKAFHDYGFQFDVKRSSENFPVFSKPLVANWDICWSAESSRKLQWWPRASSPDVGKWSALDLRCYASSGRKISKVFAPFGFQSIPFVILKLDQLVNGFQWAYSYAGFNGPEQLEFCIYAYSRLYALFASKIENEFAELLKGMLD